MNHKYGSRRYWRETGRRLLVTRLALGITEQQAADVHGVTLRTYRRYENGAPQRGRGYLDFARKYKVSLDWLADGDTSGMRLTRGRVVILPAKGPQYRRRMAAPSLLPPMPPNPAA